MRSMKKLPSRTIMTVIIGWAQALAPLAHLSSTPPLKKRSWQDAHTINRNHSEIAHDCSPTGGTVGLMRHLELVSCHCLLEIFWEVEARILEICPRMQCSANCRDFSVKSTIRAKCAAGLFSCSAREEERTGNSIRSDSFPHSPLRARKEK